MTLLDVVCVTSRLYKLRDTNDQTLESVKEQFIANYCGNKSGRFICFIDPVGKSMKCYLIPYQLYAALRMRCYSHSTQDIANGLFQPYVKENYCTVIIDFMLKDGTLIRRSFEADIRCWWSPGLFNYDMFFRSGALFFRAYASKDVNIEGKKLFVTIPKRFLVNLKKCAFSVYSGTHAKFLFAKHHRDVRTIHYLARSYVPAMIYAADDLGDKDYYFRAALMGSSYAQEKLGWQNRGLGFAMRQGKIVSIERTISGLYEGDVIKRINDRDLPRSEEELSKFIGAIPSASAVRLSFEGGREVTVIAK